MLIFAHSATSSINNKFTLFMNYFEEITLFFLYEINLYFNFRNHFAIDIVFFFEKTFAKNKRKF